MLTVSMTNAAGAFPGIAVFRLVGADGGRPGIAVAWLLAGVFPGIAVVTLLAAAAGNGAIVSAGTNAACLWGVGGNGITDTTGDSFGVTVLVSGATEFGFAVFKSLKMSKLVLGVHP